MIERNATLTRIAVVDGPKVVIEPGAYPENVMGHAKRAFVQFPTAPYLGQNWSADQLSEWGEVFSEAAVAQAALEAEVA